MTVAHGGGSAQAGVNPVEAAGFWCHCQAKDTAQDAGTAPQEHGQASPEDVFAVKFWLHQVGQDCLEQHVNGAHPEGQAGSQHVDVVQDAFLAKQRAACEKLIPFSSVNLWHPPPPSVTCSHPELSSSGLCQSSGDFSWKPHWGMAGSQNLPASGISTFVGFLWWSYFTTGICERSSHRRTGTEWENPCRWAGNGSDNISTPGICVSMKDCGIQDTHNRILVTNFGLKIMRIWISLNELWFEKRLFAKLISWNTLREQGSIKQQYLKNTTRRTNCQIAKITTTRRYSKKPNPTKNLLLKYMPWKPTCVQPLPLLPSLARVRDREQKVPSDLLHKARPGSFLHPNCADVFCPKPWGSLCLLLRNS